MEFGNKIYIIYNEQKQQLIYGHWLISNDFKYPMFVDKHTYKNYETYNNIILLEPKTTHFYDKLKKLFEIEPVLGYGINHT